MENTDKKDFWDKIDIFGKIVSGVILVIIAFFINQGANKISASNERGRLVQNLISDLTNPEEKVRQDIALLALDSYLGNYDPELVVEIATRIFMEILENDSSDVGSNLVALDIIKKRAPKKAEELEAMLENKIQSNQGEIISEVDISETKPLVTRKTQDLSRIAARVFKKLVYIQYNRRENKNLADGLMQECRKNEWTAPGVELVQRKYNNTIRYFHREDQAFATKVKTVAEKYLSSRTGHRVTFELQDLSEKRTKAPQGQVEIWLNI